MNKIFLSVLSLIVVVGTSPGCGGGTSTGNPGGNAITGISSTGYNVAFAPKLFPVFDFLFPSAYAAFTLNSVKFCVTQMKLIAVDGSSIKEAGSETLERPLGIINLGDGTQTVTWGNPVLPNSSPIKTVKFEIHHDAEKCGGAVYSMSVNGQNVTKDIEIKFNFGSAGKTLGPGINVTLALSNLVLKLTTAIQAGQFDDNHIEAYLDGSFSDSAN